MKKLLVAMVAPTILVGLILALTVAQEEKQAEEAPAPAEDSILDKIQGHGQLDQFYQALITSGVTEQFPGLEFVEDPPEGEYTVFAPTDQAIEMLSEEGGQALLTDPEGLSYWVRAHIVEGRYGLVELAEVQSVTTLTGEERFVEMEDSDMLTIDGATISSTLEAMNGVVHTLDEPIVKLEREDQLEVDLEEGDHNNEDDDDNNGGDM